MRGLFVTGTGTEVGKTMVAAAIARTLAATGTRVAVFKPVVSGLDEYEGLQTPPDHELLRDAAGSEQSEDEIAPYRYRPPVSPHLGAELAGETIEPARILSAAREAADHADFLVCEGVGGFLVPLTLGYLVRDFARDLRLPVVIASPPGLGAINQTLLTIEAVRTVGLEPVAVVLTPWSPEPSAVESSNREAISRLGRVRVEALESFDVREPDAWPTLDLGR
jgi:dethiobiotin synthetase